MEGVTVLDLGSLRAVGADSGSGLERRWRRAILSLAAVTPLICVRNDGKLRLPVLSRRYSWGFLTSSIRYPGSCRRRQLWSASYRGIGFNLRPLPGWVKAYIYKRLPFGRLRLGLGDEN
jgi:hypothetical protein